MGAAFSKERQPTFAAKVSANVKKKYKKTRGRSNTPELKIISQSMRTTTGLDEIDQSLATLDLIDTSDAGPPSHACHWNKLPTELKLLVFSHLGLILEDPIRHPSVTGAKYQLGQLSYGFVNKEFRQLSQEVWYKKNTFVVAPTWIFDRVETGVRGHTVLTYPEPRNGHLVRSLQAEFTVGWGPRTRQAIRCRADNWRYLLRPTRDALISEWRSEPRGPLFSYSCSCGGPCPLTFRTTQWQNCFPFLDKLTINLRLTNGFEGCRAGCSRHSHDYQDALSLQTLAYRIMRLLGVSEIMISAKEVDVRVYSYCGYAAKYLQFAIKRKMKRQGD